MENWHTGLYYCYLLMSTLNPPLSLHQSHMADSRAFLKSFNDRGYALRPLADLFRLAGPSGRRSIGNKLRTRTLFFIAILIIGIAFGQLYQPRSIAFAPIRTKSITIQKVLGSSGTHGYGSIWSLSRVLGNLGLSPSSLALLFPVIFE